MATITRLPSGKWRAQVRRRGIDPGETFTTKRDATRWADSLERQVETRAATGYSLPAGLTVEKVIDLYLGETPPPGRSRGYIIERLRKTLGKTRVTNLPLAMTDWARRRGAEASVSASNELSTLSAILRWARSVRRLDIDQKLTREAREVIAHLGKPTRSRSRERIPSEAELERLCAHFDEAPRLTVPMSEIVRFAAASAMRLREITSIRIEDVDHTRRAVLIRNRKHPDPLMKNHQLVPLVGDAWTLVEARCEGRASGRVFPFNAHTVTGAFTRAARDLGVEDLRFHDLRHLATVALFRAGLDIPRVSLVTGHRDWRSLKRYTNLDVEDVHAWLK